jgi:hypothetical protein
MHSNSTAVKGAVMFYFYFMNHTNIMQGKLTINKTEPI